jgi:MFS superfamily sulfate permease-like transporter
VIAAAIGLFEFADLRRIFRIQQWEFWLSVVCFAGVARFGVIPGIGMAIGIAVLEFLWDAWRPNYAVLGRVEGIRGYHDIQRYPAARRVPGLVLFRWSAPLFFANASSSISACSMPSHNHQLRCGESSSRPSRSPTLM